MDNNVLKWIAGGFVIMLGLVVVAESGDPITGLLIMACGFVALPPVRRLMPSHRAFIIAPLILGCLWFGNWRQNHPETAPKADPSALKAKALQDSLSVKEEAQRQVALQVEKSRYRTRRVIKKMLKDPDSFEEVDHGETYVGKGGVFATCYMTYRAKNSFGGFMVETVEVSYDKDLNPIKVKQIE